MPINPLLEVLTIGEVIRAYNVGDSTIRYHIDKGHLTYRQVAYGQRGLILIDKSSVIALWGRPSQDIALSYVQNLRN